MRKIISFLLIMPCCSSALQAQFLTQSATGEGAVLLPLNSLVVGFDFGKAELTAGSNNYAKALKSNNSKLFRNRFIGANLTVKNSEGIGNLFQSGDIVPAGDFSGFAGFSINNDKSILSNWKNDPAYKLSTVKEDLLKKVADSFRQDVLDYIETAVIFIADDQLRDRKTKEYKESVEKAADGYFVTLAVKKILADSNERLENFRYHFGELVKPRQKQLVERTRNVNVNKVQDSLFNVFLNKQAVFRFTPFLFGGINARSFTLYQGLNPTVLTSSFKDTLFRGGTFGLGANIQLGSFWVGVTYAYLDGDNFINLSSKEYTLRRTDTARNQALISEKKISGYAGKYAKVESNLLNIDFVKEFKLADTSRLITNLYFRGNLASRDTAYLKNISSFGVGFYFLGKKSKFLGGLYVELPDIKNNIEKAKPESERNIRKPFKKLTFGITTRFSLGSIFGWTNRPRKPD